MAAENRYDVFLSHSSKDKAVVRKLAQRLKDDGLRVWFDEWIIKPGDMIGKKIDEGLESSRVLLLCMSKHFFASEWSSMESGSFRFRDPTNKEGRFIPLRLDKTELPLSLRQFAYVEWGRKPDDSVYQRLLESIRPPQAELVEAGRSSSIARSDRSHPLPRPYGCGAQRGVQSRWPPRGVGVRVTRRCGCGRSPAVAARPPCRATPPRFGACRGAAMAAAWCRGLSDNTVRVWDIASGRCEATLQGHTAAVLSVSWSGDGRRVVSGSRDNTVRVWEIASGRCEATLQGHTAAVYSVSWSGDGRRVYSAAVNGVAIEWDLAGSDNLPAETRSRYTNAKVLLVGDSGVGKTGLAYRLTGE